MNKNFAFVVIFIGILLAVMLFMFKAREDYYINLYVKNEGTCFLDDGTCLHENRNFLVYIFGSVLSVSLIALGIYFLFESKFKRNFIIEKNEESEKTEKEIIKKRILDLLPDEKLVYDKIVESQGTIFQSELVEKTNYSKVKITRILDKLEGKGLIERKRRGMTNVVILRN
ncbi:MAG: MarR family transcriptional regulator [Candidatus Woesearchaeota archaeon]